MIFMFTQRFHMQPRPQTPWYEPPCGISLFAYSSQPATSSLLTLLVLFVLLPLLSENLLVYLFRRLARLPLRLAVLDADLGGRAAVLGCLADLILCILPGRRVAGDLVSKSGQ